MNASSIIEDASWPVNEARVRIYKNGINLSESSLIEAVCPFGPTLEDKRGYSQYVIDGNIFEKLINPLFDTSENQYDSISFWVYAPYYQSNGVRQPVENYEAYVFKNKEASVDMTAEIFNELIAEI